MPDALLACLSLAALHVPGPVVGAQHALPFRPNVLVVVADDLGWTDVEAVPTPALDGLASRGVAFENAWANPWCSPTRHTLLFGRYSGRDGIGQIVFKKGGMGLSDGENPGSPFENLSLPELLKPAGYATGAFGKWHLSNEIAGLLDEAPRAHGFDTARAISPFNLKGMVLSPNGYFDWDRVDDGAKSVEPGYATRVQADALVDWVRTAPTPWLAYLAFNAPHSPFHVPPADLLPPGYAVGPGNRGKYEAMIAAMDAKLGDVLAAVSLSDTLVVFLGDNGTPAAAVAPGQDPAKVKESLYEGAIRVPFVVAGPGVAAGAHSRALVNTVDVLATVAELAGLELPGNRVFDSVSFAHVLAAPHLPAARRFLFSEFFAPNGAGPKTTSWVAARGERYKLMVRDADGDGPAPPAELFFDLALDPTESHPLREGLLSPAEARALGALRAFLAQR